MIRATSSASCWSSPGGGERVVADVEVEVEVRVLDPERVVETERHLAQAPTQRLEEVQAALELVTPGDERVVVGTSGGRS